MAEAAKKAAPKRKTTARKAPARKTTAKRKPAARKTTRKAAPKKAPSLQSRVTDAARNAFLANLGLYGMAYDQVQGQVKNVEKEITSRRKELEKELTARRKQADKLYADMVKRGAKVEKDAKTAIEELEMPKLEMPALDRAKLEAQLEKAKARFEELKGSLSLKAAA
jgi:hypothetical protein